MWGQYGKELGQDGKQGAQKGPELLGRKRVGSAGIRVNGEEKCGVRVERRGSVGTRVIGREKKGVRVERRGQ